MRIHLAAIVLVLSASASSAEDIKTMDAIDFAIDGPTLVKQKIQVTGCKFSSVGTLYVTCNSQANTAVNVGIEGKTLDRESLRRALKECAAFKESDNCVGSVTGVVEQNSAGDIGLTKAVIDWTKPAS